MEEWRVILEYPDYEVSCFGGLRSNKNNKTTVLKGGIDLSGYHIATLRHEGKQTTKTIHRMIAKAFIPNPENKRTVNHKNGIKTDNRIENLEWNTYSENISHAMNTGLNIGNKMSVIQSDKNGNFIKEWESAKVASIALGIRRSGICWCLKGYYKQSGGYKWTYKQKSNDRRHSETIVRQN